jgi:uncharacterized protein (DUF362 family)
LTEPALVSCVALRDGVPPQPALQRLVQALGGLESRISPGLRVLIKPNFVAPFPAATTDLEFIEFFVAQVRRLGGIPILAESSGFEFDTEATFQVLGVNELAKRHNLPLINFERTSYRMLDFGPGIGGLEVAEVALHADLIINLPVLKQHTITKVTGAVKNLFGTLSRRSRRRLHSRGLHRAIAALARHFQPKAVHVADARRLLRRAVFAAPEPLGYVLSGVDPFAIDHHGCRLIGVQPGSVAHLESPGMYKAVGDVQQDFPQGEELNSTSERLRRGLYALSYGVDHLANLAVGSRSFLPGLHWRFGTHPELRPGLSRALVEQVARSCPVEAIDVNTGSIRREVCQPVRCLNCYREHPSLVRLRGFHPPSPERRHA